MTNQNLMEWQIKLAGKKCPSYIGWCWPLMNLYLARGEKACLLGAYRTSSVSSVFGCTSNYSRRFWRSQRAQGPRCELPSAPGADCVRFSASPGRFRYLFCVSHIYRYGTLQLHIWWAKFVKGVIFLTRNWSDCPSLADEYHQYEGFWVSDCPLAGAEDGY